MLLESKLCWWNRALGPLLNFYYLFVLFFLTPFCFLSFFLVFLCKIRSFIRSLFGSFVNLFPNISSFLSLSNQKGACFKLWPFTFTQLLHINTYMYMVTCTFYMYITPRTSRTSLTTFYIISLLISAFLFLSSFRFCLFITVVFLFFISLFFFLSHFLSFSYFPEILVLF